MKEDKIRPQPINFKRLSCFNLELEEVVFLSWATLEQEMKNRGDAFCVPLRGIQTATKLGRRKLATVIEKFKGDGILTVSVERVELVPHTFYRIDFETLKAKLSDYVSDENYRKEWERYCERAIAPLSRAERLQEEIMKEKIKCGYSSDLCNDFFNYWTESDASGTLRIDKEKMWDTAKRLVRWAINKESLQK